MSKCVLMRIVLLLVLSSAAIRGQGLSTANMGWYNGDCISGIPGWSAWYLSDQQFGRTFDDFVVPSGGWTITGIFSENAMWGAKVTQATWEIRSGLSAGNGGAVVASGLSTATQTLLTTWRDGTQINRIEVDGLFVQLPAGRYWVSLSPVVPFEQSYVCATLAGNAIGNPPGNNGNAFFYTTSSDVKVYFQPLISTGGNGTSGDFSQGVLLTTATAPKPVVSNVVNAASWQSGAVSPGEIVTITGTGLGPPAASTALLDQNGKVSTTLDAVNVMFGGVPSPQIYVSGGQINAVVPYEIAGATNPTLQVTCGGQTSNAFPVTVAASAPAIFTANGSGSGQAAALNQDWSYNETSHPAAKGSFVTLYLTGEGQTNPGGVTGKVTTISPVGPLTPQPLPTVTVTIGGQPANVVYYGEAPGSVSGVMQVNVQIPPGAASGNLPLFVSVGSNTTPSGVTIAVQ